MKNGLRKPVMGKNREWNVTFEISPPFVELVSEGKENERLYREVGGSRLSLAP